MSKLTILQNVSLLKQALDEKERRERDDEHQSFTGCMDVTCALRAVYPKKHGRDMRPSDCPDSCHYKKEGI